MATSNTNNSVGENSGHDVGMTIVAMPGETIELPFASLQDVTFSQDGGNLIITPVDGGPSVLLQDFLTFAVTENPPAIGFANGNVVVVDQITPLVEGYSVADISPQAGNNVSDGGGAHFQPFHDGSIGDPLGIADLLPPTDLSFSREEADEIIGKNEDFRPIGSPNPGSDVPTVIVTDAAGKEDFGTAADQIASVPAPADGNIALAITLTTGQGGTEDGWVILSGYPAAVTFSAGAADAGGWRVEQADLAALTITGLPADSDGDFSIIVTPWSQDGAAAATAGTAGTIDVLIDAVADLPTLTLDASGADASVTGNENTAIGLPDISAALQDTDGSESLSLSIDGVPTGATLTDGTNSFIGNGSSVDVTGWNLANMSITPVTDDTTDFSLSVTATSLEAAMVGAGGELQEGDNTASTSLTINVTVDDVPVVLGPNAVADGPVVITEPLDTHAVFIVDTSASLSQNDLALMEQALKNLATTLFSQNPDGTKITIIDFDSTAKFLGGGDGTFTTLASTLNALNGIDSLSGGGTSYYEALNLARTIDFDPQDVPKFYFLSDGVPTESGPGGNGFAINSFNDWVNNDLSGAEVYSVGIGAAANNSEYLGLFDNTPTDDNVTAPGGPYLYVDDAAQLNGSLVATQAELSGNVLTNDSAGDNPLAAIPIVSVAYNGTTYDLSDDGNPNVTVSGNNLTLTTDFGVLELNFQNGDYHYVANTDVSNFESEVFSYTISDTVGSTSTADLNIQISPDTFYTGTQNVDTIMGGTGNDYIAGQAGDDSLTGNDGDDRFVFQSAQSDGDDVIHDFGTNGDHDVIDLSAVFDDLNINSGDRADHVVFSDDGTNTTITVTDGANAPIADFSVVVENSVLTSTDITNGKIVVDES
ncbi:VWA domain-containing protein [Sneathiella sp.]|uniref:VWA domain-containing protein n=1 Tax=Sneathiella sp. TaxID=1964365 RepID=UPI0035695014